MVYTSIKKLPIANQFSGMADLKGTELLDVLSLLCSEDSSIRRSASSAFVSLSFAQPEQLTSSVSEIKLVILSLCATPLPFWGTISSVVFALANAINLHPASLRASLIDYIEISKIVTRTAFAQCGDNDRFPQILSYYAQSLIKNYGSGFQITREIILSVSAHCLLGFLPCSSLVQLLVVKFQQVLIIAKEMGNDDLMELAKPLACADEMIINFYLALWVNLMASLLENPFAVQAIRTQSLALFSLTKSHEDAKVLVNIFKASPKEKAALSSDIRNYAEAALRKLKVSRKKSEIATFKKDAPKQGMSSHFEIHIAEVSVLVQKAIPKKLKSKKWTDGQEVRLVEEASILFWRKKNGYKATALQCSDIENVSLLQKSGDKGAGKQESKIDCDVENVIMIQTLSSKQFVFLEFQNYELANQWINLIKQAKLS